MAFRRKQDIGSGEIFSFEKVGQKITGYYLGTFDHEGNYGPTKKHVFKTEKGIKVVFGQTHLTQLLEGEEKGKLVQVTYVSDKKMKKGNPMKMYTLDIDDEQALDPNEIPDSVEEAVEPEDDYADDEPAEDEDDAPPADEVKTAPARNLQAKGSSASSAERAKEILNRRRAAS